MKKIDLGGGALGLIASFGVSTTILGLAGLDPVLSGRSAQNDQS